MDRILPLIVFATAIFAGYYGGKLLETMLRKIPISELWITAILVFITISVFLLSFMQARKLGKE